MLSIVIPCYNHAHLLPRSVGSALSQTVPCEVIVVDDGSTEPVQNIWGNSVTIIHHETNKGLSTALNTGIKASAGERFAILAADDALHPEFMAKLSAKDADIVSCDMKTRQGHLKAKPGDLETYKTANCHGYAALIRRKWFELTGGFKKGMDPSWEDWEFYLNCAKLGAKWAHVPEPLHLYNRNPKGRDVEAQGKDTLLRGKLEGFHQDVFGQGRGLVSFIIPCYNQEDYVLAAIESALNQVYPHTNVVLVDDGSPGNIWNAIKTVSNPSRLLVVRQPNKHLSAARNVGINAAIRKYHSQYLVALDADDTVHPNFIERLLASIEPHNYVYSDVQFIGDAWHQLRLEDYDCRKITSKHLHPCTFLMNSDMFMAIQKQRGYGYDESMKKGYEDWEFALAAIRLGYCGKRYPEALFNYRNHKNGSMRTEAAVINDQLVNEIHKRHPWVENEEQVAMACSTCAGRASRTVVTTNAKGVTVMNVNVPGIGLMDVREPVEVTYTGSRTDTMTKIGRGLPGQGAAVYKYSANNRPHHGRKFTIYAIDAHLFVGPFSFRRMEASTSPVEIPAPSAPRVTVVQQPKPAPVAPPVEVPAEPEVTKSTKIIEVITYEPDDFTELGLTSDQSNTLHQAGISYLEDLEDASAKELASVLKLTQKECNSIKARAAKLLDEAEKAS